MAENVVRGAKERPRVKGRGAEVWSEEQKRGRGSKVAALKCGLGSKRAAAGQASHRSSVVWGAKPRPQVKPAPAGVWSGEQKSGRGSSRAPLECGPGSKIAAAGQR